MDIIAVVCLLFSLAVAQLHATYHLHYYFYRRCAITHLHLFIQVYSLVVIDSLSGGV